jgi:hypothetical protein
VIDYSKAKFEDVEDIVRVIRGLRDVARKSHVTTVRTQSLILRSLPADILCHVAVQLNEPTDSTQAVK